MTIEEIRASDKTFLLPTDVAEVFGCDPHTIRLQARENPSMLGFPVTVMGKQTRIPRVAFLAFVDGKLPKTTPADSGWHYADLVEAYRWNGLLDAVMLHANVLDACIRRGAFDEAAEAVADYDRFIRDKQEATNEQHV